MPAFSVKLAQLYQLDLAQAKIEEKNWDAQSVQNKMRKHFLGTAGRNWETIVTSVKCSTGGAKGVYFLNLGSRTVGFGSNAPTLPAAMCAMKATDAPQQTLFAENILHDLGNAKIPKSLVIPLTWAQYQNYDAKPSSWQAFNPQNADDGLKLLWVIVTKRDPTLNVEENKRYDQLCNDLFTNKPKYFVIMKGVRIDDKLDFASNVDPFRQIIVDPFRPGQQAKNKAYRLSDLGTIQSGLTNWWEDMKVTSGFARFGAPANVTGLRLNNPVPGALPPWYTILAQQYMKFSETLKRILLNKLILSNADLMRKAGRILAIDTLIGNTDRFEGGQNGMNIGNAFFYSKLYQDRRHLGKAANPIAVIDNEAMLTLLDMYTPEGALGTTDAGVRLDSTIAAQAKQIAVYGSTYSERLQNRYLEFVLDQGGNSALAPGGGGAGVFFYPKLERLFTEFDLYIAEQLVRTFISVQIPLIADIYADDGTLAPGTPGAYPRFSDIPYSAQRVLDQTWAPVVANIKTGFMEGMDAILNLDLDHYRAVYSDLLRLYGLAPHFDFTAFEVRLMYIKQGPNWTIHPQTRKITGFQHDNNRHKQAIADIKANYLGKTNQSKNQLEQALRTAEISQQLGQTERRLATELLRLQFGCP